MTSKGVLRWLLLCSWLPGYALGQCLQTIDALVAAENLVTDVSVPRSYELCPSTIFTIGIFDYDYNIIEGQPMIPIRPNLHLKCGPNGLNSDLCIVGEGDVHMDATGLFGIDSATVENVTIEGLTFLNARRYSVWSDKPGDITFVDCEFRDNVKAIAPLFFDFFPQTPAEQSQELVVNMVGCSFVNNRYFGEGAHTAVIVGNGMKNSISLDKCFFERNDFIYNNTMWITNSFLIETSGPLSLTDNCFTDNLVGVANVVVYGDNYTQSGNYGFNSSGSICPDMAAFETAQSFESFAPLCTGFDSQTCRASATSSPSESPSESPSDAPSESPSEAPSDEPSVAPSEAPSEAPTSVPSEEPTSNTEVEPPTTPTAPTPTAPTTPTVPTSQGPDGGSPTLPPSVANRGSGTRGLELSLSVLLSLAVYGWLA